MKGRAFNQSWPQVIGQVASAIAEKEDMVGKLNDGNVLDSQLLYRFKCKGHAPRGSNTLKSTSVLQTTPAVVVALSMVLYAC